MDFGEPLTTCPKCGIDNLEGVTICSACGTPLESAPSHQKALRSAAEAIRWDIASSGLRAAPNRSKKEKRLNVAMALSVALFIILLAAASALYGSGAELRAELQFSVHDDLLENQTVIVVLGKIFNDGKLDGHAIVHLKVFTGSEMNEFEQDAGRIPAKSSVPFSWAVACDYVDKGRLAMDYWVTEYETPTP